MRPRTGLSGNTVRRLVEDPARWATVVSQPSLIPGAVEETLRYDPSVPVWRRITTRPVTLGGVELPAGARLFLWLAAAGRIVQPSVALDLAPGQRLSFHPNISFRGPQALLVSPGHDGDR